MKLQKQIFHEVEFYRVRNKYKEIGNFGKEPQFLPLTAKNNLQEYHRLLSYFM